MNDERDAQSSRASANSPDADWGRGLAEFLAYFAHSAEHQRGEPNVGLPPLSDPLSEAADLAKSDGRAAQIADVLAAKISRVADPAPDVHDL